MAERFSKDNCGSAEIDNGRVVIGVDAGRGASNEDAAGVFPLPEGELWVLADGVGGEDDGECASEALLDSAEELAEKKDTPFSSIVETRMFIQRLFNRARQLMADQHDTVSAQAAATAVIAVVSPGAVHVGHVGDCKARLFAADGSVLYISEDNSKNARDVKRFVVDNQDPASDFTEALCQQYPKLAGHKELVRAFLSEEYDLQLLVEFLESIGGLNSRTVHAAVMQGVSTDWKFRSVSNLQPGWQLVLNSDGVRLTTHELSRFVHTAKPRLWDLAKRRTTTPGPALFSLGAKINVRATNDNASMIAGTYR